VGVEVTGSEDDVVDFDLTPPLPLGGSEAALLPAPDPGETTQL
jgi:hypothetical protein